MKRHQLQRMMLQRWPLVFLCASALHLTGCDSQSKPISPVASQPASATTSPLSLTALFQQLERSSLEAAKLAAAKQIATFKLSSPLPEADLLCLKNALKSGDARLRVTALGVLQRMGPERSALREELRLALADSESLVRFAAAQTLLLCDKSDNEALRLLLNGLADLEKQEGAKAVRVRLSENLLRLSPLPLECREVLVPQLAQSSDSHRRLILALIHRMKKEDSQKFREPIEQLLRENLSEPLVTELKQAIARMDSKD